MEAKVIRPQVHQIQKRFFEAVDTLIERKIINSLSIFCEENGLHRPKYSNIRTFINEGKAGTGYKLIDVDALSYLVEKYGISGDWLLTGRGEMFKKQKKERRKKTPTLFKQF